MAEHHEIAGETTGFHSCLHLGVEIFPEGSVENSLTSLARYSKNNNSGGSIKLAFMVTDFH